MVSVLSKTLCFGCEVQQVEHESAALGGLKAVFSVIVPPCLRSEGETITPLLYYLSGLTCTDQNFIQKAGACRAAAQHGVLIVAPDTSPRGAGVPGEDDAYDFGTGAGFYVNATAEAYRKHYRMYDYVTRELPQVVHEMFPVPAAAAAAASSPKRPSSIFGHSMGGHGALVCALRNPGVYRSVSAFAPIAHPSACPWGQKAFQGYLGSVEAGRAEYDATELVRDAQRVRQCGWDTILIDQGAEDNFLHAGQLRPEDFVQAAESAGQSVTLRYQPGYDHSYFFIQTFVDAHIAFHAKRLHAQ
eukprot:ctg_1623.g523